MVVQGCAQVLVLLVGHGGSEPIGAGDLDGCQLQKVFFKNLYFGLKIMPNCSHLFSNNGP